jgi:hypothetical protein
MDDGIPLTREEEIEFLRSTPYDAVIILNCHGRYGNRKGFLEKYVKNLRRITKKYKESMKKDDKKSAKGADFKKYHNDASWHVAKSGRYLEKLYTPFAPHEGTNKSVTVYLMTNPRHRDVFNIPIPPNGMNRTMLLMWCERNGIRAPLIVDAACSGFEGQQTERQTRKLRNHLKKEGIAMGGRKSRRYA